jgi:hypothetical protein
MYLNTFVRTTGHQPRLFYRYITDFGEIVVAHFITKTPNHGICWPDLRYWGRAIGYLGESAKRYSEMAAILAYNLWLELKLPFRIDEPWSIPAITFESIGGASMVIEIEDTTVRIVGSIDLDDQVLDLNNPTTIPEMIDICKNHPEFTTSIK